MYDAIVVGARCAGSPTAMVLARKGYRVLLLDRATGRCSPPLARSIVPKLFVNGEPGAALTWALRKFCRSWPAQTEVTVRGLHFLQEDPPDEIGGAIVNWMTALQ
jgi:flavin-dependent dehydrogenase